MENKINIAEILKDCPTGMELDCTVYEDVHFDYIDNVNIIHCYIQQETYKTSLKFTQHGTADSIIKSKCVIFPKGKTTWEGFVPPCKFKDGDVCYVKTKTLFEYIFIFKVSENDVCIENYVTLSASELYTDVSSACATDSIKEIRFATEEEKQKFFQAIKDNGYHWNAETKTLEKLVEPKFKVGDKIQDVDCYKVQITAVNEEDEFYEYSSIIAKGLGAIPFKEQNNWELVSNKFDINTLKPFESKVLVRNYDSDYWKPAIFGFSVKDKNNSFCVEGGNFFDKCIPYEGNEHLLGTREYCNEYYKTW